MSWLLDHLLGVKRAASVAPIVASVPQIQKAVDTVDGVVGLIPAKITTESVITTAAELDPEVLAKIQTAETAVINVVNAKLTAAGVAPTTVEDIDAAIRAEVATLEGGPVDTSAPTGETQ